MFILHNVLCALCVNLLQYTTLTTYVFINLQLVIALTWVFRVLYHPLFCQLVTGCIQVWKMGFDFDFDVCTNMQQVPIKMY
jgi:hypothetical protein